jgi:L-threonylcarbamoyladenylate synthase
VEPGVSRILRLDHRRPDPEVIDQAVAALSRGELVVIPTETVYGLAGDPRVPGAVEAIYKAKGRPDRKPVTWFAANLEQVLSQGATLGPGAERLARRFWPGPLTLVLRTPDGFFGFRVPDHAVPLAVLRQMGSALAVTSANRSGEAAAITADEAAAALGSSVTVVLDAGPSPGGVASTVVRVEGEAVEILRDGAIPREEIRRVAEGR